MNLQTLWSQSRLAAPFVRARLARHPLLKKVISLFALAMEPCRIPSPVPVTVPARRPRAVGAIAIALLGLTAAGAMADDLATESRRFRPGSDWNWNVDGRLVEVSILVDGSTAPLYVKPGAWDRSYFQAFRGRNYAIQVRNTTGRRVGVLIAVDGLNVVNGERSRMGSREPMYVLGPYENATIRGWRTSLSEVRRFVFVDEERSYAERTGQANGDMGWIRVHAFRENRPLALRDWDYRKGQPFGGSEPHAEAQPESRADGAPSSPAPGKAGAQELHGQRLQDDSNPGTGWGDRSRDPVTRTEFLAERSATDRITLRYEYESGLRALGIFPVRHRTWDRERGELGFAKPPRW